MTFADIDGTDHFSRKSGFACDGIHDIDWHDSHRFPDVHPNTSLLDGRPAALLELSGRTRRHDVTDRLANGFRNGLRNRRCDSYDFRLLWKHCRTRPGRHFFTPDTSLFLPWS